MLWKYMLERELFYVGHGRTFSTCVHLALNSLMEMVCMDPSGELVIYIDQFRENSFGVKERKNFIRARVLVIFLTWGPPS